MSAGLDPLRLAEDICIALPAALLPLAAVNLEVAGSTPITVQLYADELRAIGARLLALRVPRVLFVLTTPFFCSAEVDGRVREVNARAKAVMASLGISTLDLYAAAVAMCGGPPPSNCSLSTCPHYTPRGYEELASSAIVPAIQAALTGGSTWCIRWARSVVLRVTEYTHLAFYHRARFPRNPEVRF